MSIVDMRNYLAKKTRVVKQIDMRSEIKIGWTQIKINH